MQRSIALTLSLIFAINIFWPAISLAAEDNKHSYISITSNMSGASIYLNGEIIGTTPIEQAIIVKPGAHSIKARKEGYSTTWREDIYIAPGETVKIMAIMVPLEPIDPETLKPRKKPFTKSWLFWIIALIGIGFAIDSLDNEGSGLGGVVIIP